MGVELRVGELLGLTQPPAHTPPLPRRQQADPDVSVLARKYRIDLLVAWPAPPQLAGPLNTDGRLPLGSERRIEGLHDRLEPREVDIFSCATT